MKCNISKSALTVLMCLLVTGTCYAQAYPSKPVRIIVPGGAGSPPDVRARWMAERLRIELGQAIVIENKSGASGAIGTYAAARSPADGYTLVMVHQGTMALNPHLSPDLSYDPIKDFAPIIRLGVSPLVLTVHPDVPVRSVGDLVRLAKEKPGQLNFGHPGVGTPPHMAGELFRMLAHLDVLNVPYKTTSGAQIDLMAGRLTYAFDAILTQLPQVRAGNLRAVAVTSAKRLAFLPDVPTIAESGLPGYEYWSWMGLCAPAGTPKQIIMQLNTEIAKILRTKEARDWFAEQGAETIIQSPEEFAAFIQTEHSRWGKFIHEAGIKLE
jgi:tripartite-type tricarboxylate transporter receptor subunit TctC